MEKEKKLKMPKMETADHQLLEQRQTTEAVKNLMPATEASLLKHHENGEKLDKIHAELVKGNEGPKLAEASSEVMALFKAAKGDKGDTPVKGVDYFTDEEKKQIINEILPIVTPMQGKDYYTEEEKNKMAEDVFSKIRIPADGYTPQKGVDYEDGDDADEEAIEQRLTEKLLPKVPTIAQILEQIPIPKDGINGSPDSPEEIIKKLRSLKSGSRINYDELDNLPDIVSIIRKHVSSKSYATSELTDVSMQNIAVGQVLQWDGKRFIPVTVSAGLNFTQVFGETPSGAGTAFSLAHTPLAGTVRLYRGGAYQQSGTDYTIIGANITLSLALAVGEVLLADYNY